MPRFDLRLARKLGSTVTIDGAKYTIGGECFYGGTALCYSASRDGQIDHYMIKEVYPPTGAMRNDTGDVCPTSGSSYEMCLTSFRNEILLMDKASSVTYQCAWYYEHFDLARGIGVMRRNSEDTKRLDEAVEEYAGRNHTHMERLGWALRITRSLLTGLDKIHTNSRLLHLDLSLTNIFLSQDGNGPNTFFLDFGEARQLNDLNVCPADSGSTSLFGAPERFSRSTKTISPAADTFSAAVLFYHILTTGSWAYQNQPIPEAAMLSKWDCAEAKYGLGCLELPVGTENAVFRFLKKGMAYRPDRRYQTAMEMLEQVERLLQIVSQKGVFRELILDRSAELYQKTVFYKISPDLEPQIPTSDRQHILYLGDGGSGKTTHLFTLWKQTLEKAAEDFCSPLPIYVSVSKFEGQDSNFIIDQILKYYIKDWDGGDDVGRKQINKLLSTESYVLFLDGLNESTMPDGLYQQIELLTKYPMLRIYAASRVPFNGQAWDCFEKVNINELSEEQVDYILRLHQRRNTYHDRLLKTLRRPMFMAIFLRLGSSHFAKEICTPGEILEAYWEHLIGQFRDANHPDRNAALWKYALNTALPRFSAERKSLHFSDHQVNFRYPAQEILQVWQNCGLVKMVHYSELDDREDYVFTHQNYRDFAVAKRLAAEMKEWNDITKMYLASDLFDEPVLSYLGDVLGEYAFSSKRICPSGSPIEQWMQKNLYFERSVAAQITVRNLIDTMKIARISMTACYDGLDLTLANFCGKSIEASTFHNAIIAQSTFFSQSHKNPISCIAYLQSLQYIVTASNRENQVIIWNRKTQSHVKTITGAGDILHLAVSESTNQIAWISDDPCEITVFSLDTSTQRTFLNVRKELLLFLLRAHGPKTLHFNDDGTSLIYTCAFFGQIAWDISVASVELIQSRILEAPLNSDALVISCHTHKGRIGADDAEWCEKSGTRIDLWDASGKVIHRLDAKNCIEAYAISPNQKYFVYISNGELCYFDLLKNGTPAKKLGKAPNEADIIATNTHVLAGTTFRIKAETSDWTEVPGQIWDMKTCQSQPIPLEPLSDCIRDSLALNSCEIAVHRGTSIKVFDIQNEVQNDWFGGNTPQNRSTRIHFAADENRFYKFPRFSDEPVIGFSLDKRSSYIVKNLPVPESNQVFKSSLDPSGRVMFYITLDEAEILDAFTGEPLYSGIKGNFLGFHHFRLIHDGGVVLAEHAVRHQILLINIEKNTHTILSGVDRWVETINWENPEYTDAEIALRNTDTCVLSAKSKTDIDLFFSRRRYAQKKVGTCIRDIHAVFEDEPWMISSQGKGMLALWRIDSDSISKQFEERICGEWIDRIVLIPHTRYFLAISSSEWVYFCEVKDNTLNRLSFWSVSEQLLGNLDEADRCQPNHRFVADIVPVSQEMSHITFVDGIVEGVLIKHRTGEIVRPGIPMQYYSHLYKTLVSRDQSTFVTYCHGLSLSVPDFEVYSTKDCRLRWKGTCHLLLDCHSVTISNCGTWIAVSASNEDVQVINTHTGVSTLWPKSDVRNLCGCDFRSAEMDDRLRELLRMNGGIC